MLETRFNCVVVTASETRNRARYIIEPLVARHHSVKALRPKLNGTTCCEIARWFRGGSNPDIIVFIGVGLSTVLLICFAHVSRSPVIIRLGGHPLEDKRNFLTNLPGASLGKRFKYLVNFVVAKVSLKLPRYIICVNEALARRIKNDLRRDVEVFVIPQFSDGSVAELPVVAKGSIQCLTIANLNFISKVRGIIWLIQQLNVFCERTGVPATFRVAGDGICKPVIEEFLASFDQSPLLLVELLGFVQEVDRLYSSANVFLYYSEHDGTPNVLLEAKRWGIPTLVNNYAAFRSIIADGETGFIFEDEDQFQDKFERLIDDRTLRLAVSCGARRDHESRFSIDAVGSQLEDVLQRICEQHAHR